MKAVGYSVAIGALTLVAFAIGVLLGPVLASP
jgi:hypothetical protein